MRPIWAGGVLVTPPALSILAVAGLVSRLAYRLSHPDPRQGKLSRVWMVMLGLLLMMGATAVQAAPVSINNQAQLAWRTLPSGSAGSLQRIQQLSNTVALTPKILTSTASSLAVYRYASSGSKHAIGPAQYGDDGGTTFNPLPNPLVNGTSLDPNKKQPLLTATQVYPGAPRFVCLTDGDQNIDKARRNHVTIKVTSGGQTLRLKLTETGNNSGVFCGYFMTTTNTAGNAYTLAVAPGDSIKVAYQDSSDTNDTAQQTLSVPAYNRVLNGSTGKALSGVKLTLINTATGQKALVFGQNDSSRYPASVTSGTTQKDAAGFSYQMQTGNFIFPRVPKGRYKLKVDLPAGYRLADSADKAELQKLSGAPLVLNAGSYGKPFTLKKTRTVGFDVPVLPTASGLYVSLQGDDSELAIGDMSQFTVMVENTSSSGPASQVTTTAVLPPGFRYQPGSLRINGAKAGEPTISANGGQLTLAVGNIAAGAKTRITYVTRATPGAPLGRITSHAQASALGGLHSNVASFALTVKDDLMQGVNTLIGRVFVGCQPTRKSTPKVSLKGIRLLLETGRYAATDAQGRYHFAELKNGTHVVQVDPASLPPGYEFAHCEKNTRFAGRASSQFVELHGGALWRADFYLKPIPPASGRLGLQFQQLVVPAPAASTSADADKTLPASRSRVKSVVSVSTTKVAVKRLAVMVSLAPELHYLPGSSRLDGKPLADPTQAGNTLVFRLGDKPAGWQGRLVLSAKPGHKAVSQGRWKSSAFANFGTVVSASQHTHKAAVSLAVKRVWNRRHDHYVLRFGSGKYRVKPVKGGKLDQLAAELKQARQLQLDVTGYADTRPVRKGAPFKSNQQLSQWRAKGLAARLKQQGVALNGSNTHISGRGTKAPVASNATAAGRARNRRAAADVSWQSPSTTLLKSEGAASKVQARTQGKAPAQQRKVPQPPSFKAEALKQRQRFKLTQSWLDETRAHPAIVWPQAGFTPASPAVQVAIKHAAGDKVALEVNGQRVSSRNFVKQSASANGRVAVDQWLGVGLHEGDNTLSASITRHGKSVAQLTRKVHFSGTPVRAEIVPAKSWLEADGQHRPFVAVRFFDRWGKPVRPGVTGNWQVGAPYKAWQSQDEMQRRLIARNASHKDSWTIAPDGLAYLVLAPTTESGKVDLTLSLGNGDKQFAAWLKPQQRDWVLVGLADGTLAFNDIKGHMQGMKKHNPDDDLWQDDRVAFYAKGMVKGKYLITAAYDSAKKSGAVPQGLDEAIDPNRYYMLYGDASDGGFDASSAKKLYLKIARGRFYALFGNFSSGLTVTDLSRYQRRFTGVKSSYQGKRFGYTAFGAENTQAGVHDEIQGDGTSGLYQLSHTHVLLGSETISLVTRNRYTHAIIKTQQLSRYLDYNLDYATGKLFFRTPVPNRDANFNPIYIVANYEVKNGGSRALTAGGRGYVKLDGGRWELGASAIQEGSPAGNNHLWGVDITGKLTDTLTLKAETAHTRTGTPGSSSSVTSTQGNAAATLSDARGSAYEISLEQQGETLHGKAFYKQVDDSFGLGQQSLAEVGTEQYGWDGRYNLSKAWSLTNRMSWQQGDSADSRRFEAGVRYRSSRYSLNWGVRHTESDMAATTSANTNNTGKGASNQLTLGGSLDVTDNLSVHAQASQAVGRDSDSMNPSTTQLGANYNITSQTQLFANQSFAGDGGSTGYSRMTEVGVNTSPAAGTKVTSSVTQQQTEYGPRLFSTAGLTQDWKVSGNWSLSAGMSRSQTIHSAAPTPNEASVSANADTQDFTSGFVGSSYEGNNWVVTNRAEYLTSKSETRYGLFGGVYRQLSAGTAVSSSLQLLASDFSDQGKSRNMTLRFGIAQRPSGSDWSLLNQTDFMYSDQQGDSTSQPNIGIATSQQSPAGNVGGSSQTTGQRSWRLVNNTQINYKREDSRWQWTGYYGAKFARYDFGVGSYNSYVDLIGTETRYDVTDHWDLGLVASRYHDWNANVSKVSYGAEVGYDIATNLWLSVGYNVKGFYDQDFSAAHYTAQGAFLRFRFKFDQDTLKAMAKGWR